MLCSELLAHAKTLVNRARAKIILAAQGESRTHSPALERLSEEKERRFAERYRVLVENAPVCIHEIDRQRTLSTVNRAGLRMLGRGESVFGVPVLSVVSPADRQRVGRLLDLAFTGEFCEFEFTTVGERTFLSCFMPLKEKHGTVRKVLGVSQEITHRKSGEDRFRQILKMEALGKLAGGVAHDFNNILNVIVGYAHLIEGESDPDKMRQHASEILEAATRAGSLTRQLLAFSRKQVPQPQALDLNQVIEGISKMLRRLVREEIEISVHLASGLPQMTADAGQMEQVIVNLVVNAQDAISGIGRVSITTQRDYLDQERAGRMGLAAGDYAVLTVSDDGHGIDPETQAHIFEPFFTTKGGAGTGLGLASVHAIVAQSAAHISVESQVGKGTVFTLYFPASTTTAEATKYLPAVRPGRPAGETILLAEDEQSLRKLMAELLRGDGYTVLEASDGPSAIETSKKYKGTIDLLVTDMVMPKMQGSELASELRKQRPGIKVLYITGYADSGRLPGANMLEKPFMPETLLQQIRSIIDSPDQMSAMRAG